VSTQKYYLFQCRSELWIVKDSKAVPKPRELLIQTSNIEYLREYAHKIPKITKINDKVSRQRNDHWTPEGRKIMSEKKLGSNNPMHGGLSEEHKLKISRTMRGTRRGENNPMYGRRHRHETRRKMSIAQSMRVRKWCVEPSGKTHLVDPRTFILPGGWKWGRFFDPYK